MNQPSAIGDLNPNLTGVVAMLASCAFFVFGDAAIKTVGRDLPLGQMLLIRGIFSAPIIFAIAAQAGQLANLAEVATTPLVVLRAGLEIITVVLFLIGILNMPYADALSIQQSNPLIVMAAAAVFLGEPVGWRRWSAAGVGFLGVLIIIRPGGAALNWPAFAVLGSVAAMVVRDLVTRRLNQALPSVLIATVSVVSVGLSGLLLLPFESWRSPDATHLAWMVFAAVGSIGGFYWMIKALRTGEVAVVVPFRYALIPFGAVMGLVGFNEWPDLTSLIGMAIVVGAGLYVLRREHRRPPRADATC